MPSSPREEHTPLLRHLQEPPNDPVQITATLANADVVNSWRLGIKLTCNVLPLVARAVSVMGRIFGVTFAFSIADKPLLAALPLAGDFDSTTMLMMGRSLMPVQNFVGVLFGENKALEKERDELIQTITKANIQDINTAKESITEKIKR